MESMLALFESEYRSIRWILKFDLTVTRSLSQVRPAAVQPFHWLLCLLSIHLKARDNNRNGIPVEN